VLTPSTIDFFNETEADTTEVDQKQYRSTIMALMFAAKRTRSDILLHVTYLSSYCGRATSSHVKRLNRILLFLAATVNRCITIKRAQHLNIKIDIFADAGHLTHHDMKGHTGILLRFNHNFVLAFSKKQILFSESSCESELYAAHTGGLLAKWVVNFFEELKIKIDLPIIFYQDNQSTIKLSNKGYGDFMRTKHIKKRYYSIKDLQDNNIIQQRYCPSHDMLADLYTKSHDYSSFKRLTSMIHRQQDAVHDNSHVLTVQGTVGNQALFKSDLEDISPLSRKPVKRVTFDLSKNILYSIRTF
jgi:hypothetical protein